MPSKSPPGDVSPAPSSTRSNGRSWPWRIALWGGGALLAAVLSLLIVIAIALAVAFPNLPDISDLSDYRPKLPLRVFSAEGVLIGEFGEERRHLTPIAEIPKVMTDAVLAIEDARFYEHGGLSLIHI